MSLFKKKNIIEAELIDADHVSASHKLEVNDLFYFLNKKVQIKEIKDINGNTIKVLCVGE